MSDLVPYSDMEKMAGAIAKSNLFGVKTPDQAVALMLLAQAEGMHPAKAIQEFHIIQGRPALKADAMLGRFQRAGGSVKWKKIQDDEVIGIFSHPQGGDAEISWTFEMAQRIGLTSKDNWRNYPRQMLRSRVISEGVRTVFPGCITGIYTDEETENFNAAPARVEKNVTPATAEVAALKDDIPWDYKLMVPGMDRPYHSFQTEDEWIDGYAELVHKIKDSTKFTDKEKDEKIVNLRKVNEEQIHKLKPENKTVFITKCSVAIEDMLPKKALDPSVPYSPNPADQA